MFERTVGCALCLLVAAGSLAACKGSTKSRPIEVSVAEAIKKAQDEPSSWFMVTGLVCAESGSDGHKRVWLCASAGDERERGVTCDNLTGATPATDKLAQSEGKVARLTGKLTGWGKGAQLLECEVAE